MTRPQVRPAASFSEGNTVEGRDPDVVMRPERLGAFHQTRLSFSRALMRRMRREGWTVRHLVFDVDSENEGEALYHVGTPKGALTFIALAHKIRDDQRTDRAIARFWDYTFALSVGAISGADLERLRHNLPLQDDGRYLPGDLVFSRANKSGRIFDEVVAALADGQQPDAQALDRVGYLIRTTAVFANGKMGLADFGDIGALTDLGNSFEVQMLTVWLIREFSIDLVNHLARVKAPDKAVLLDGALARDLGVGNATGLGMVPFLVDHPLLLNSWVGAREVALARVCSLQTADTSRWQQFVYLLGRAKVHLARWYTEDVRQAARIATTADELARLEALLAQVPARIGPSVRSPWAALVDHAESAYSIETRELIASLVIEPHGPLVDDLEACMSIDEIDQLRPEVSLADLLGEIEASYGWAIRTKFSASGSRHFFWYRSEVKGEPRLGIVGKDEGEALEMTVGIAREVMALHADLVAIADEQRRTTSVGHFLLNAPEHRATVERVQTLSGIPYAEIRGNLLAADFLPIDILRCKLSFFGATRFDPKSDRWVRVVLFQGAPLAADISDIAIDIDDWLFHASGA